MNKKDASWLWVFFCLFLLGCPPSSTLKDEHGIEIPSVTVNNDVTRVRYSRNFEWEVFYSETPEVHNSWYDASGVWAPNNSSKSLGKRLTEFWQKHNLESPTEEGKELIKRFHELTLEEAE